MFNIFNYLKNLEEKLHASEIPEVQFLDISHYKNENFNLNSFSKIVMTKLNDTNYMINQLRISKENLKNEIVEQINSNFNNYVVLISKLQTIDFLIENIDKPLQNIKKRIDSEINFIEKYEKELYKILQFLNDNVNGIRLVKVSLKFYKIYTNSKNLIKLIEERFDNLSIINNIINNYPDDSILNHYDNLRKFLFEVSKFNSNIHVFYYIFQSFLTQETELVSEIKQEEIKYLNLVEEIMKICLNEYFSFIKNNNSKINQSLIKNLLVLICKIYNVNNNEITLFNKIQEISVINDINFVFDNKNKNLPAKLDELLSIYNGKYIFINEIFLTSFENNSENEIINKNKKLAFNLHSFIIPVINKLSLDKFIFNCVDPDFFRDNYLAIIKFLSNFLDKNNFFNSNIEPNIISKIKVFINNFSFFTYFQYLQNEMSKIFIDDYQKNKDLKNSTQKQNEVEEKENDSCDSSTIMVKNLTNLSNFLFNYIKLLEDIFRHNKAFVKILPNFLNFIVQCNKYIINRHLDIFDQNKNNIFSLLNTENFSFEETNLHNLKKAIIDYLIGLENYLLFFIGDLSNNSNESSNLSSCAMNSNFIINLTKILEKEIFILKNSEESEKIIKNFSNLFSNFKINVLHVMLNEFFSKVLNHQEISKEKDLFLLLKK